MPVTGRLIVTSDTLTTAPTLNGVHPPSGATLTSGGISICEIAERSDAIRLVDGAIVASQEEL
jgi:hypothetical protein